MPADEKAIEEAAQTARHYLDRILLEPLSEFGLLLKENVSFWRFKNQVRMVEKARKIAEAKGVDIAKLAGKVLPENIVPLIEAGSKTGDPVLSDLFAGLLATAVDPNTLDVTHPSFAGILSELSPLDAVILINLKHAIDSTAGDISRGQIPENFSPEISLHRQLHFSAPIIAPTLKKDENTIKLSFQNLRRLGVCDYGNNFLSAANQEPVIAFTDFGLTFISACTPDSATPRGVSETSLGQS